MRQFLLFICSIGLSLGVAQTNYPSGFGPDLHNDNAYEKGELIITYERISRAGERLRDKQKFPQGRDILIEHQDVTKIIKSILPDQVFAQRPVFSSIVNAMIDENMSEPEVYEKSRSEAHKLSNTRNREEIPYYNFSRSLRIYVDPQAPIPTLIQKINDHAERFRIAGYNIQDVVANSIVQTASVNNDIFLSRQFAHQITGAPVAWNVERGNPDIVIGVIDTGIDFEHEDLQGKIVSGFDFVHRLQLEEWQKLPGEDYQNKDNDPSDFEGHGTHVSGIAAARGNNGIGISGVCPDCSIMPLRAIATFRHEEMVNGVLDTVISSSGNVAESAEAVVWAVDNGADVINMSFAGNRPWAQTFRNALLYARNQDVVLVSSAANDTTAERRYPAAHEEVIAVASTAPDDTKSFFSNYGTWVDVSAPGEAILSTIPKNAGYPAENLVRFTIDEEELQAIAMTFSGNTLDLGVSGSLSFVGLASAADVSNTNYDWDLEGKIALIERGEISFREKVERVQSFGAIGAIVFNNEPGIFRGTLNAALPVPMPVFSTTQEIGNNLRNRITNNDILSAKMIQSSFEGYTRLNGTSFASPYVAGIAGLILSNDPSLSPDEVSQKITEAVDNIDAVNPQYVGQLGSGRVNLTKLFPQIPTPIDSEITKASPIVFPNPTNGTISIRGLRTDQLQTLRLFDLTGRSIQPLDVKRTGDPEILQLNISSLPQGWYLITGMDQHNHIWTEKVYKEL